MNQNYERWGEYSTPAAMTWIIPWIKRNIDSVVFISCLLIGACVAQISSGLKRIPGRLWIVAAAILGVAFVLFTVPARRFALGYFALAPALLAPVYRRIAYPLIVITPLALESDWRTRRVRFIMLIISLIAFAAIFIIRNVEFQKIAPVSFCVLAILLSMKVILTAAAGNIFVNGRNLSFWLAPPPVEKTDLEIWVEKEVNDIKYIHSLRPYPDGRCWAAELPCTPWLLDKNIRLRDPKRGLAAGIIRTDLSVKTPNNSQIPPDEKE
jgi:hypothetical protein